MSSQECTDSEPVSIIDQEVSSCETSQIDEEFFSCASTIIEPTELNDDDNIPEVDEAPLLDKNNGCSSSFVIFNVCFVLSLIVLSYLILESPTVTKDYCNENFKECLMAFWKDTRRYFDFYH